MYATPRTRQESVAMEAAESQGVKIRAKRNATNLPNSWTGKGRTNSCATNNWKRHRKAQWYRGIAPASDVVPFVECLL